jgi:neutral ceramidase
VISLANGELQGYMVTEEAAREGGYEALNSFFGPHSGRMLVDVTLELLRVEQARSEDDLLEV